MFKSLQSVILYVRDAQKSKGFYVNTLGFKVNYEDGDYISLKLEKNSETSVDLNGLNKESNFPGHQTIILKTTNIDHTYKKLKELGVNMVSELVKRSWGNTFIFTDLDGNRIEVV